MFPLQRDREMQCMPWSGTAWASEREDLHILFPAGERKMPELQGGGRIRRFRETIRKEMTSGPGVEALRPVDCICC